MKYFVIKKLVQAESIPDALKRERNAPVTDVWEDDKRIEDTEKKGNVGYRLK
jgi:hypothetical protein